MFVNAHHNEQQQQRPSAKYKSRETKATIAHLDDNVQVFTDLPPKVDGSLKSYLKVEIAKLNWLWKAGSASIDANPCLAIRILWWGEDGTGSLFRPKVNGLMNKGKAQYTQTTAKYKIKSGAKQLNAYFNDMAVLEADLIDEKTMKVLGKAFINEIAQLSETSPINGFFSVYNDDKIKLAEIHVCIKFEALVENQIELQVRDLSWRSNSTAKYNENNFKSLSPSTTRAVNTMSLTADENHTSGAMEPAIIKRLLDKGKQLKEEMLKSTTMTTTTTTGSDYLGQSSSRYYDTIDTRIRMDTTTRMPSEAVKMTLDTRLLNLIAGGGHLKNTKGLNDSSILSDFDDNQSDLSDPMHNPDVLTRLFYTADNGSDNNDLDDVYAHRRSKHAHSTHLPSTKVHSHDSRHSSPATRHRRRSRKSTASTVSRPQSRSRSSSKCSRHSSSSMNARRDVIGADAKLQQQHSHSSAPTANIDYDSDTSDVSRVSFDMPGSSDDNGLSNDGLSVERIKVLGHVHVARVYLDKINIILDSKAIFDSINNKFMSTTSSDHTKPPKSFATTSTTGSADNVTYFVEYQFPVIANSRDQYDTNEMATEVMRVVSKRHLTKNIILFSHRATFPILFNGNVLEKWWTSSLHFKLYARLSNMKAPVLIGLALLPLKQILKSDHLKVDKTINIKDRLSRSILGTLDFLVELTSDSKTFENELVKLKLDEESSIKHMKIIQIVRNDGNKQKLVKTKTSRKKNNESKHMSLPRATPVQDSTENDEKADRQKRQPSATTQVQFYLNVNEMKLELGKDESLKQPINLYLVCRLFWCNEKLSSNTLWNIKKTGNFNFAENMTLFLNRTNMSKMHNNYMIIEVWMKKMNKSDVLYGIIKLPLNQFYVTFMDKSVCDLFCTKSKYPAVSVDTWMPCMNPFSGQTVCQVNVLMAMGTTEQIGNLQEFKFNRNPTANESVASLERPIGDKFISEYLFEIKFDAIRNLKLFDSMIWGETDCFIQYYFPIVDGCGLNLKPYRTSTALCIPDMNMAECVKHSLKLNWVANLKQELFSLYNSTPGYMTFEIWLRYYHPNVRDQIIGKCFLDLNRFCSMLNDSSELSAVVDQSFDLNIFSLDETFDASKALLSTPNKTLAGKQTTSANCGDLSIQIRLCKRVDKNHQVDTHSPQIKYTERTSTASQVCINIGLLRACGLKSCAKYAFKNKNSAYLFDIGLNVHVKVRLNDETKQTRTIIRSFTPEFYNYFDYMVPLLWTNAHTDTVPLAHMLETLNVEFELWHHEANTDNVNKDSDNDVLIGVCSAPLKDLLLKQTGIKGWLPVRIPDVHRKWSITDKQQADVLTRFNGAIEVLIRFANETDRVHVLNNAKQYGWTGIDAYFVDYSQLSDLGSLAAKTYIFTIAVEYIQFPAYLALKLGDTVVDKRLKCYLRYKFYNCNEVLTKAKQLDQHVQHDQYLKCTFKFTSEHVVRPSAPLLWYLNEEKLEIQVWLTADDDDETGRKNKPNSDTDKYLGSSYVDMNRFNRDLCDQSRQKNTCQRINDLNPIFKSTCKELNGAYCQVYVNLDKSDNFDDKRHSNAVLMHHTDLVPNKDDTSTTSSPPVDSFKCIVGVERALHLPKVHDKLLNRHVQPNAYVTYSCLSVANLKQTHAVEQQSCPIWNHQELVFLNVNHLYDENKCLVLKVWHKVNPDLLHGRHNVATSSTTSPEKSGDKVLGFVSIDLCPLLSGLQQITGWYNIIDMIGNCQGQLKISLIPQESLYEFKLTKAGNLAKRARTTTTTTNKTATTSFHEHLNSIRLHHDQLYTKPSDNDNESCLKTNLRKQLDELDKINEKFKEKLIGDSVNVYNKENTAIDKCNSRPVELAETTIAVAKPLTSIQNVINQHAIYLDNAKEVIKKANSLLDKNRSGSPVKINDDDQRCLFSLPPIVKRRELDLNEFKSNDSFWASKFEAEGNSVCTSSSSLKTKDNESTGQSSDNDNHDTDLDQTTNSYLMQQQPDDYNDDEAITEVIEIKPLNSVSGMDFDCQYAQDPSPTTIMMPSINEADSIEQQEVATSDANILKIDRCHEHTVDICNEPNQIDKLEIDLDCSQQQDDVISQQLITTVQSDTPTVEVNNISFKDRPSMPNFFLPPSDLEKSMRQLHLTYQTIDENPETQSDRSHHSRLDEVANRLKSKSPSILSDRSLSSNTFTADKDLDRLNKIFRAKYDKT